MQETPQAQLADLRQFKNRGKQVSGVAIAVNLVLAVIKIVTGLLGHSYALVADGIESTTDIVSSLVVWGGLHFAAKPPDANHPYGHGKAESMAALLVAFFILAAAVTIAVQSVREILTPHRSPAWYTLVVLGLVIVIKESLYRFVIKTGDELHSSSLRTDAWHHRADAITSLAAFVGISIALAGHLIGHLVQDRLRDSGLGVHDVVVHVGPDA